MSALHRRADRNRATPTVVQSSEPTYDRPALQRRANRDGSMEMMVPTDNPTGDIRDGVGNTFAQNRIQRRANLRLIQRPADAALRADIRPLIKSALAAPYDVRMEVARQVERLATELTMSKETRVWMLEAVRQIRNA